MWVVRIESWMKFVIEDLSRRLKCFTRSAKEKYLFKYIHQAILPTAIATLEAEYLWAMQNQLASDLTSIDALHYVLHIFYWYTLKKVLDNHEGSFIVAFLYIPKKICYISISAASVRHRIKNSIGTVRDCYICFSTKHSCGMTSYKERISCYITYEQDSSSSNNRDSWLVRYMYHSYCVLFALI